MSNITVDSNSDNNSKRNKLIELAHMIRGTYPNPTRTKAAAAKGKPTLKLRWLNPYVKNNKDTSTRTKSASSLGFSPNWGSMESEDSQSLSLSQQKLKAAKLQDLAKMIRDY